MKTLTSIIKKPNICKYCGSPILAKYEDKLSNIKRKTFCDSSCFASYNNTNSSNRPKQKENYCINCGTKTKSNNKYCSSQCKSDYEYKQYIYNWKNKIVDGCVNNGWKSYSKYIRKYLFEKYNNKCSQCGWGEKNIFSNTIPLEVEHIDGDSTNNSEENLTLLCPNCHSLTKTYRGLNRGKSTRKMTWKPKD